MNNVEIISFGVNGKLGEGCAFLGEQYCQQYQQLQNYAFVQLNSKRGPLHADQYYRSAYTAAAHKVPRIVENAH